MTHLRISQRAAAVAVSVLGASLWTGCSDRAPDILGPSAQRQPELSQDAEMRHGRSWVGGQGAGSIMDHLATLGKMLGTSCGSWF